MDHKYKFMLDSLREIILDRLYSADSEVLLDWGLNYDDVRNFGNDEERSFDLYLELMDKIGIDVKVSCSKNKWNIVIKDES